MFVKLVRDELPKYKYATSDLFILRHRHENQLYDMFKILRKLTRI